MPQPGAKPLHILIVEDNDADVLLVREALKHSGLRFQLTHVLDGEQAILWLRSVGADPTTTSPNLVILDLNIPKRDGWEVLSELRSIGEFRSTPIVILSSSGNPDDQARAENLPAVIYIRKPSTLDDFMSVGREIRRFSRGLWGE